MRVSLDYNEESHWAVVDRLREAGFRVLTAPIGSLAEPEATLEPLRSPLDKLRGFNEINEFLENRKSPDKK